MAILGPVDGPTAQGADESRRGRPCRLTSGALFEDSAPESLLLEEAFSEFLAPRAEKLPLRSPCGVRSPRVPQVGDFTSWSPAVVREKGWGSKRRRYVLQVARDSQAHRKDSSVDAPLCLPFAFSREHASSPSAEPRRLRGAATLQFPVLSVVGGGRRDADHSREAKLWATEPGPRWSRTTAAASGHITKKCSDRWAMGRCQHSGTLDLRRGTFTGGDAFDRLGSTSGRRQPFVAGTARPRILEHRSRAMTEAIVEASIAVLAAQRDQASARIATTLDRDSDDSSGLSDSSEESMKVLPSHAGAGKSARARIIEVLKGAREKLKIFSDQAGDPLGLFRPSASMSRRSWRADRDKISGEASTELALESFQRYFPGEASVFQAERALEALADFGIMARTRPEKLEMRKALEFHASDHQFTFEDFCSLVEEARPKLRAVHASTVLRAIRTASKSDEGILDGKEQLGAFLKLCDHGVDQDGLDAEFVLRTMEDMERDESGRVSCQEAEVLAQQLREFRVVQRRRLERSIKEHYGMPQKMFVEFRSQLIELHDAFSRRDSMGSGHLNTQEALALLADFGYIVQGPRGPKIRSVDVPISGLMSLLTEQNHGDAVVFPAFLTLVRLIRNLDAEASAEEMNAFFNAYDRDGDGELDMREICQILALFDLQPRNPQEQEGISRLMEEVDYDGSGKIDSNELVTMVQRISEKLVQMQRAAENRHAQALRFSTGETMALRHSFEALDVDCNGTLNFSEVERAVHQMGWRCGEAKLQRLLKEIDEDCSSTVDFTEFLSLMRRIEDELQTSGGPGFEDRIVERATSTLAREVSRAQGVDSTLADGENQQRRQTRMPSRRDMSFARPTMRPRGLPWVTFNH